MGARANYRRILGGETQDINNILEDMVHEINDQIDIRDSLKFWGFLGLDLQTCKYDPFSGGSYMELGPYLTNKEALINIENENNERCFWYCLILGMVTPEVFGKNPQRESKYKKYVDDLDDYIKIPQHLNIDTPPSYCDYAKIAQLNHINLQIWETKLQDDGAEEKIYPLFNSKNDASKKTITMLLVKKIRQK